MNEQAVSLEHSRFNPDRPLAIASFVLLGTIGVLSFIVQPALVQGFVTQLHLSESQAVDLAGVEMGGVALVTVLLAFLGNRVDWRWQTILFLLVAALGNAASAFAPAGAWLSMARFITGLGEGGIISLSFCFVGLTRKTDLNLSYYLVVLLSYGALGVWLAPTLFATIGLKGIFLFFAAVTLASVVTVPFLPRSSNDRQTEKSHGGTAPHLPLIMAALMGVLVYNLAQGIAWADLFLIGIAAGLQEQTVANALFVSQIVAVGGALAAILLAERVGRMPMFVAGIWGGVACIALLMGKPGATIFLVAVCGFNFLWNMVQPFILGAVNEMDNSGRMMRVAIAMQMIGLGGGPILSARLMGAGDFTTVEWVCIGCFALCFVLLAIPMRMQHIAEIRPHAAIAGSN
jgi:MFS family permease